VLVGERPKYVIRSLYKELSKYKYSVILILNENGMVWSYYSKVKNGKVLTSRKTKEPMIAKDKDKMWMALSGNIPIHKLEVT